MLPQGETLHETLLLGLHPHGAGSARDLPSWERDAPSLAALAAEPQPSTGPCDRYTRLSRAVLLVADGVDRRHPLRWIRFGAGLALLEDEAAPDPMSAYRAGAAHLVRLNFTEGKAAWRDLGALLPDETGQSARPAAILNWAVNLVTALGADDVDVPVLLAGLTSDQAKLVRWRSEHVRLPAATLSRADVAQLVREALAQAESTHRELRQIVAQMLARTQPDPTSKDTYERARTMVSRWPVSSAFFSVAEQALPAWLQRIGRGEIEAATVDWNGTLLRASEQAWQTALAHLGHTTAALRAQAQLNHRYLQLRRPLRVAAGAPEPTTLEESTP